MRLVQKERPYDRISREKSFIDAEKEAEELKNEIEMMPYLIRDAIVRKTMMRIYQSTCQEAKITAIESLIG